MEKLQELIKEIGAARIGAAVGVGVLLTGMFIFIYYRVSDPILTPLFTELSLQDSSQIVSELESSKVIFELKNEGSTILVPKDQVLKLRMLFAEKGVPEGGSIGYEIFDKTDNFGATSFVQNINKLRALEGELTRTIKVLRNVTAARVHLVIPEKKLFLSEQETPTASITLKLKGSLSNSQIKAIQHLVASAVGGLNPRDVSIVDESGKLLASGNAGDEDLLMSGVLTEKKLSLETILRDRVEAIITNIVGRGNVRAQVSVELQHSRVTQTMEKFDPESQVVRSTRTKEESSKQTSNDADDTVTVSNELPDATGDEQSALNSSSEDASNVDETINYEISKEQKTEIKEAGEIKKVTVAVLVNDIQNVNAEGNIEFEKIEEAEINKMISIVKSAVGFDENRGDKVEVVNMRFAAKDNEILQIEEVDPGLFSFSREEYLYFVELGVFFILGLLILLVVVRPLMQKAMKGDELLAEGQIGADGAVVGSAGAIGSQGSVGQLTDMSGGGAVGGVGSEAGAAAGDSEALLEAKNTMASKLTNAQELGREKEETIKQIGELIDNNPVEAATIVRQWVEEKE